MKNIQLILLGVLIGFNFWAQGFSLNFQLQEPRIIRGKIAYDGQIPYQIRTTVFLNRTVFGWCGGSIIAECWILTAAHCSYLSDDYNVWLGFYIEAGSVKVNEPRQSTSLTYFNVHVHPDYNTGSFLNNDLALYRTTDFTFDRYVQPIGLAPANWNPEKYLGKTVVISGFGIMSNNVTDYTEVLQYAKLTVVTTEYCQSKFDGVLTIPSTSFCAEDPTPPVSSACYFDSGGPLTLKVDGTRVLIGLLSYVLPGACDHAPQGFTNIAMFRDWIETVMNTYD
ncbi:hypothetical protein DMENIID0001_045390 [Sergentomyia squamirostris]